MHVLENVRTGSGYTVEVDWDDGRTATIDFAPTVAQGGVFAPMGDRAIFEQVAIGPRGRSLVWPNELDFCADALYVADNVLTTV